MVYSIIQVHRKESHIDERADLANKQVETEAYRILVKFSQTWRSQLSLVKNNIAWRVRDGQSVNVADIFVANSFAEPLAAAMKSGNFAADKSASAQTGSGVTQSISRLM